MNPSYGIILWVVIGAIAGWVASMIMKTNGKQGVLMDIVVGVVGAVLGGFITRTLFHDSTANNGLFASFGVALLGSVILIGVLRAVTGGRGRPLAH
ncbi:MAG: GlsB/YeaQ/YmgE family stress response membrane protein [Archangiaceae bacterium]|nr:GlsB/YeaQ/YmgE family stress response membrane protein [Archangiaceae bacterium]MBK7862210.1 GlsB/YeaQ/YmgE family stress response membrane protein [Archangiaceae bacterium]